MTDGEEQGTASMRPRVQTCRYLLRFLLRCFPSFFPGFVRETWRNLKDWKIFLEDSSRILEKEETYEGGKRERIKREIYFVKEKDKIYLFLFILENLE